MANNFQIVLSAVDRATSVVRQVNGALDRLTRPVVAIRQSLGNLARETGLDRVAKGFGTVAQAAGNVATRVTSLAGPFTALIGAGIGAMVNEWGRWGAQIQLTADLIGATTSNVQSLRGAADVAGASGDAMADGLKRLGDTMEDALFGRNQQALVILQRLGIGINHTATGSIDAARGFRDLSGAIAGVKNAQVQSLIARTFGLETVLPLLRQGPAAIAAYEARVGQLGGVMSGPAVQAAAQWQQQITYLHISLQAARNAIGAQLLPILSPLLARMTDWIVLNKDLIGTNVANFVTGLAQAVGQIDLAKVSAGLTDFGQGIGRVVDFLGGWKNAAIALVVVLNAGLLSSIINLGLALGSLTSVAIPAAISCLGALGVMLDATLVPMVLRTLLSLSALTGSLAVTTAGVPVLGAALAGLSSMFLSVGAAIAATPIGWLLAGVAAIAFSVYAVYKNWDKITSFFSEKFAGVKAAFGESWLKGVVKALEEFNPVTILAESMNGLIKWLFDFDLFDAGQRLIGKLISGVMSLGRKLPDSVQKALGLNDWLAKAPASAPAPAPAANALPRATVSPASGAVSVPGAAPVANSPTRPDTVSPAVAAVAVPGSAPVTNTPTRPAPLTSPAARAVPGIRNNNPGNLRKWGKAPQVDGFAVFDSPQAGLSAMIKNLQAQERLHGLNTISGIIGKWAPPKENKTGAYIAGVSRDTGRAPDEKLNLQDPQTVMPMISAIIKHEGNSAGYSEEMIRRAVADHFNGASGNGSGQGAPTGTPAVNIALTVSGLPPGASVSAANGAGTSVPVRVVYTMPTGVTP
jgi:hypothetical protein